MTTYADGGALARALTADRESMAWLRWSAEQGDALVTSPLGLAELRRAAHPLGPVARAGAHAIAEAIRVVRFSDQSLASAAMAHGTVPPFTAIHLGIAVAEPDVVAVATYDALLARMAVIYGLHVVSPGRSVAWWDS